MKMWTLGLQVVVICVLLQVSDCSPPCLIVGSVANCAFKNLRSVPPLPPNITHLYLEKNEIAEINSTSLSGLEQLQELDLGRQWVLKPVIRNNTFSRQKHLKRLALNSNADLQLEPNAFEGLSSLQNLNLGYCSLQNSILTENYLEPLSSLETLDLAGNYIRSLQPSMHFANMTNFKKLNLKMNRIGQICEPDLAAFRGKHFEYLNLQSVVFWDTLKEDFDWQKCGNPFRGISIQVLDLSNNAFRVARAKQFFQAIEGTKIFALKLSGNMGHGYVFQNESDPDNTTFDGLKRSSVLTLDLSENMICELQPRVFSALKEVAVIDVSQNRLNKIHRGAFAGLEGHLKMLNLSHNLLGEIHSYTFTSLANLTVLDLSHNHISILGFGSFSGLSNLKALNLTGNSLRLLFFPAILHSLDYLLLDDNKLTSLSVRSLTRFAGNVIHLSIQDNRLRNLGDVYTFLLGMERLQKLFYGGNRIRYCKLHRHVSAADLTNFTVLDLHSSSLQSVWSKGQCLNLFDYLGHVISLNLSRNALRSLPRGVFKGLTALKTLDLSFNDLTYLQPDVLPKSLKVLNLFNNDIASPDPAAFRSLSHLDLNRNTFCCDQDLTSFLTWLSNTNVTLLTPAKELRCVFPRSLYNVPLLEYAAQVTQH